MEHVTVDQVRRVAIIDVAAHGVTASWKGYRGLVGYSLAYRTAGVLFDKVTEAVENLTKEINRELDLIETTFLDGCGTDREDVHAEDTSGEAV